jgi:hypothetical protein
MRTGIAAFINLRRILPSAYQGWVDQIIRKNGGRLLKACQRSFKLTLDSLDFLAEAIFKDEINEAAVMTASRRKSSFGSNSNDLSFHRQNHKY